MDTVPSCIITYDRSSYGCFVYLRKRGAAGGRTKMIHGETFKGVLVGMVLNPEAIEQGFSAMNVSLKQRVEKK